MLGKNKNKINIYKECKILCFESRTPIITLKTLHLNCKQV